MGTAVFILFFLGLGGLWIGVAVYVYMDASKRNVKRAKYWFFGMLALGPIGLIAYLVDRPEAKLETCPYCGETILKSSLNCPYCGEKTRHRQDHFFDKESDLWDDD